MSLCDTAVYDILSDERRETKHIAHFCLLVGRSSEHEVLLLSALSSASGS